MFNLSRMKRIVWILFLQVGLIVNSACHEDSNSAEYQETLLNKQWRIETEVELESGANMLSDCHKDDIYQFSLNGTYTVTAGSLKCFTSESDPGTITTHTWLGDSDPDLNEIGQRLISVSNTSLKTRIDFSGRMPVVRTYRAK
jgi:hypothetical protein